METIDKIREIIADVIDIDIAEIHPDSRIIDDLGADSLDIFTIVDRVESEFGIELTYSSYSAMGGNTVAAVAKQIRLLLDK